MLLHKPLEKKEDMLLQKIFKIAQHIHPFLQKSQEQKQVRKKSPNNIESSPQVHLKKIR